MIAKWIDIDGGKWRIVVNYDVTPDESVWITKQLRSVNAYESDIEAALRLFYEPNRACTVSDPNERMSVVCIGGLRAAQNGTILSSTKSITFSATSASITMFHLAVS